MTGPDDDTTAALLDEFGDLNLDQLEQVLLAEEQRQADLDRQLAHARRLKALLDMAPGARTPRHAAGQLGLDPADVDAWPA